MKTCNRIIVYEQILPDRIPPALPEYNSPGHTIPKSPH